MKYGRVMIAAPRSGSGKTIITCGLLSWLGSRGYDVRSYKCGPDYIDPMFHRRVLGVPGGNLDSFFSGRDSLRAEIAASGAEAAVIEGVMGIYDGVSGGSGQGSCYDVARATDTPVLLVIDVKGMGQTMLSVIKGILTDDNQNLIRGIVLNRISGSYYRIMQPSLDEMLSDISAARGVSVELLGGIPDASGIRLESRHLGLMMPEEIADLEEQVAAARDLIADHLNTDRILEIMKQAEDISGSSTGAICEMRQPYVTLAVARDEAFCFYYEENLRMLRSAGMRIIEFSPLHDNRIPDDADGLLLGGGYPELYAGQLAGNTEMIESVRAAIASGMPSMAECGGFMYLMDSITDEEGMQHQMCGILRGSSHNAGRLGRFGYITVKGKATAGDAGCCAASKMDGSDDNILAGLEVRAHEFHYYDSDNNGSDAVAVKPGSGKTWECIHAGRDHVWGYPHLYYPSCPLLIERLTAAMAAYRNK